MSVSHKRTLIVAAIAAVAAITAIAVWAATPTAEPDTPTSTPTAPVEPDTDASTPEPDVEIEEGSAVLPDCTTMHSPALVSTFASQGRVSEGDISSRDSGYGTTDPELVSVLMQQYTEGKISCTWFVPPEYFSTTSVSIFPSNVAETLTARLDVLAGPATSMGESSEWFISTAYNPLIGEYNAQESHIIAPSDCLPGNPKDTCIVWVSTTGSTDDIATITRDAVSFFSEMQN